MAELLEAQSDEPKSTNGLNFLGKTIREIIEKGTRNFSNPKRRWQ